MKQPIIYPTLNEYKRTCSKTLELSRSARNHLKNPNLPQNTRIMKPRKYPIYNECSRAYSKIPESNRLDEYC